MKEFLDISYKLLYDNLMIIDIKYLSFLSVRLRNFKKKEDRLWNCSCPICGDSTNNQKKARGYFFSYKNRIVYKCHKCGVSTSFSSFLKNIDSTLYSQYRMERIGKPTHKKADVSIDMKSTNIKMNSIKTKKSIIDNLIPIQDMAEEHQRYLINRKIPMEHLLKYFYYTDSFKRFSNTFVKESFSTKSLKYDEARIVIVFYDADENISCIQGRELQKSYAKYVTIKPDENEKIFGLDRIKTSDTVYVLEGPIDSLFIDNGVAVCGADLISGSDSIKADKAYVFDNEKRSVIAKKKMNDAIEQGKKIVIFPNNVKEKDINDMALKGHDVNRLIRENVFDGLKAKIRMKEWAR